MVVCPSCGAESPADARFCSSCGHAFQTRSDERRVVTILFADLVGFTTWSENQDPEQVKALVDRAFERLVRDVTTFGGLVDKIIGDAIVALFGAPTAHEDDAERAVRAALRMQESLAEYAAEIDMDLRMRIGVNTGEVLTGALRSGGDYTAMGDVVNTASRLQTSAAPATVLVGESTYAATRDAITYEPRGELVARGREKPIAVWCATGTARPPGYRVRRRVVPLVGRAQEMSVVENSVALSVRNDRAQVVLLLGEAGVGKSRMAEEIGPLVTDIRGETLTLVGRCVPYGEANPWWPIADAIRNGLEIEPDDTLPEARTKASDAVERNIEDSTAVATVVNGLLHLMGYEGPLRGLDPARARAEATQALLTFLESIVRTRPLVIRLADLHWADDLVLETIDDLISQLSRSPLVLVGTARRALLRRWTPRSGRHNSLVLNLEPLDRESASCLLDSLAQEPLPAELHETLLDRAGGNPFFLEELVSLLVSDQVELPSSLEVPDTLRGLIAARIDGLTAEEQVTLEDAAVWGSSGPFEALARLALWTRGVQDITPVLASLDNKEILTFDGVESEWSFRSDLVREVAYARLTKYDRLKRHHGIASYMEQASGGRFVEDWFIDTVSRHYTEAARLSRELGPVANIPDDLPQRAVHWLSEAGSRAEHAAAWVLAVRRYTLGLELTEDSGFENERLRFLVGRTHARCELWEFDGARSDGQEAVELAESLGQDEARARALLSLGDAATRDGKQDEAEAVLARAIEAFEALDDHHGRAEALRLTGMAALFHNDHERAQGPIEEALAGFREVGDRRGEAWALQNLAWIAFARGKVAAAEARLGEAAATFTEVGDTGGLMWTLGLLSFVRFYEGRFDEALDLAGRVLRESERRGDRWGQGMMMVIIGSVELWSGRTSAAVATMERSVEIFRSLGDSAGRMQALGVLGRSQIMAGNVDAGLNAIAESLVAEPKAPSFNTPDVAALASLPVRVQLGDPALDDDRLGVAANFRWDEPAAIGQVDVGAAVAVALAQLGRVDEAAAAIEPVMTADEATGGVWAAAALVGAVRRDADAVREAAEQVRSNHATTYLDRVDAFIAEGLSAAAAGDRSFGAFASARDLLSTTEDELTRATVALAESIARGALGDESADTVAREAKERWEQLGVDPAGWRRLFQVAVEGDRAGAE